MSFYQNPFDEYRGTWMVGDSSSFTTTFKVPGNRNRGEYFIAWNTEPYDLSANNSLTINFAFDLAFKNWASFSINVAGATPSATKASEIAAILNATPAFSDWYTAGVDSNTIGGTAANAGPNRVWIRQQPSTAINPYVAPGYTGGSPIAGAPIQQHTNPAGNFRTYISNTGAELGTIPSIGSSVNFTGLLFNKNCGYADIPSYFDKDTIANRFATNEANNKLVRLSQAVTSISSASSAVVTSTAHGLSSGDSIYIIGSDSVPTINGTRVVTVVDANNFSVPVTTSGGSNHGGTMGEFLTAANYQLVVNGGLVPANMQLDWQHLGGRCPAFTFTNYTYDGNTPPRVITQIVYSAGALAGQMAIKTAYTYTGSNTTPTTVMEIPYVLTAADLLTP